MNFLDMDFWQVYLEFNESYIAKGVYSYFLGDEGEEQVRASHGVKYERLVALKIRYGPTNFFRFNKKVSTKAHLHR